MAKKPEQSNVRRYFYNRMLLEWVIIILLLIVIWLLLAMGFRSWPFDNQNSNSQLGSAFYTGSSKDVNSDGTDKIDDSQSNGGTDQGNTNTGGSGNTGSNGGSNGGNNGGNGNTGGNNGGGNNGGDNGGNNGGGSGSSTSPILSFAAGLNRGNTKQQVTAAANGLNEKCTVVADTTAAGKQEVCVYTEGSKIVTVTLLNDRVLSASRSGF